MHDESGEAARGRSVAGVFVVQFRDGSDVASGVATGRVEEVASGDAAQFRSVSELLDFIIHALQERNMTRVT